MKGNRLRTLWSGLTITLLSTLSGFAGAQGQTWPDDKGNGNFTFLGCYVGPDGVQCDLSYTLTKLEQGNVEYNCDWVQLFTSDGKTAKAYRVAVAGSGFYCNPRADVIKDVPVTISIRLPLPAGTSSIRALVLPGKRLDNVPVSSGNAPAPIVQRPATPAPAPAPAVNADQYNIQLSGCKATGNGAYTCTGAVVTPRR
ncbi:hypothetical protein HNQ10_000889 [Deinococcus metallilatus]|uniref:Uncharacterized protein n=1 Tax=Deinococcus metallilatus TaxID=1211322 RepID=A0ABR6MQ49_9DEIO|nr:hypothetical protein [Deinococcus metallilatus]